MSKPYVLYEMYECPNSSQVPDHYSLAPSQAAFQSSLRRYEIILAKTGKRIGDPTHPVA